MSISISARVRPLLSEEKNNGERLAWKTDKQKKTLYFEEFEDSKRKRKDIMKEFSFSDVFDFDCSNQEIYNKLVKELVSTAIAGLSASFFVYGQTGSGKTYSISGGKLEEGVF